MKVLVTLFALLMASVAFSSTIKEDVFNTNVIIKKDSLRCSLFARKLKMKLNGLEDEFGSMGTRYFKSIRTYSDSCKVMKGKLLEKLNNRRAPLDAKVVYNERIIRRTVNNGGDHKSNTECESTLIKTARLTISQMTLETLPIVIKREERRSLGTTYGACR